MFTPFQQEANSQQRHAYARNEGTAEACSRRVDHCPHNHQRSRKHGTRQFRSDSQLATAREARRNFLHSLSVRAQVRVPSSRRGSKVNLLC